MDPQKKYYIMIVTFVVVLVVATFISYHTGYSAGATDALSVPLNRPAPHAY